MIISLIYNVLTINCTLYTVHYTTIKTNIQTNKRLISSHVAEPCTNREQQNLTGDRVTAIWLWNTLYLTNAKEESWSRLTPEEYFSSSFGSLLMNFSPYNVLDILLKALPFTTLNLPLYCIFVVVVITALKYTKTSKLLAYSFNYNTLTASSAIYFPLYCTLWSLL